MSGDARASTRYQEGPAPGTSAAWAQHRFYAPITLTNRFRRSASKSVLLLPLFRCQARNGIERQYSPSWFQVIFFGRCAISYHRIRHAISLTAMICPHSFVAEAFVTLFRFSAFDCYCDENNAGTCSSNWSNQKKKVFLTLSASTIALSFAISTAATSLRQTTLRQCYLTMLL